MQIISKAPVDMEFQKPPFMREFEHRRQAEQKPLHTSSTVGECGQQQANDSQAPDRLTAGALQRLHASFAPHWSIDRPASAPTQEGTETSSPSFSRNRPASALILRVLDHEATSRNFKTPAMERQESSTSDVSTPALVMERQECADSNMSRHGPEMQRQESGASSFPDVSTPALFMERQEVTDSDGSKDISGVERQESLDSDVSVQSSIFTPDAVMQRQECTDVQESTPPTPQSPGWIIQAFSKLERQECKDTIVNSRLASMTASTLSVGSLPSLGSDDSECDDGVVSDKQPFVQLADLSCGWTMPVDTMKDTYFGAIPVA